MVIPRPRREYGGFSFCRLGPIGSIGGRLESTEVNLVEMLVIVSVVT